MKQHSNSIQTAFKQHSNSIQTAFKQHSNSIQTAFKQHSNSIQTAFKQHSNSIQTAFKQHSNSIQTAFKQHSNSIQTAFKQIIADKIDKDNNVQVKNFIKRKIRDSSCNPKLNQIENMLTEFDPRWRSRFDEQVSLDDKPRLRGSLTALVDARNEFAHGGNPDLEIEKTIEHFLDGVRIIQILDSVVQHNYDDE